MKRFVYRCGETENWIPVAESYHDCIELAQSDYYRVYGKRVSVLKMMFCRGYMRLHFWLRMSSFRSGILRIPCQLIYNRYCRRHNIQLSPSTKIGYGFYLGHGTSLIVNPTAIIGNNCNLSQFTTIGSNKKNAAVIGNNVYIAPSVCLVENIHIGNGAAIGAGAVVVRDVAADTTVAGVPARKVSDTGHPEYINRCWPIEP